MGEERLVADAIVERLRDWGATRVFGYAGDGINTLLGAMQTRRRPRVRLQPGTRRHAAFSACGHAKYTGEVGVCMATQGPGAIHLLAGLYDAKLDRRPVVAIVGQVVSTALGSGYLQEVDLHTLFKDVCVAVRPDRLRSRAGADRARQRHAHRHRDADADVPDHPARRAAGRDAGGDAAQPRHRPVLAHRRAPTADRAPSRRSARPPTC